MLAQYVYPSTLGLFRIIRHGRRWRALREGAELGRFECEQSALHALRDEYPHARLPARLERWRFLPQLALVHARASDADEVRWQLQA
ncbi:hypothetical protein [Dyella sp. KULCS107]|uniref:hypothetical protein n=1 Tax=unclassified Dyella TaxID=2634549 RepID=UPI003D6E8422